MSNQVTIGGDRLGAGGKRKQSLHNFERSTFDQSYLWRSTVSMGTLVPFMNEILLPGDSAEINLDLDVLTSPTLGPLFGSAKCQLDVFQVPIRLYVGALNMNKLNVGNDMYDVKLPLLTFRGYFNVDNPTKKQVNPSSLPAYLGLMGLASNTTSTEVTRSVNMLPYLAYWDIVKNYYANLQEERFFYIHNDLDSSASIQGIATGTGGSTYITVQGTKYAIINGTTVTKNLYDTDINDELFITTDETESKQFDVNTLKIEAGGDEELLTELYYEQEFSVNGSGQTCVRFYNPNLALFNTLANSGLDWELTTSTISLGVNNVVPTLKECALTEIDDLLEEAKSNYTGTLNYVYTDTNQIISDLLNGSGNYSVQSPQEGLCVKTYQADLFNNWIKTDWIDGTGGITETTAVDTTGNSFSIDTLNLAQKTYEMLNRIAISGGTYKDWIGAVYSHEARLGVNSPMYLGSLIKELAFQEVVSTSSNSSSTSNDGSNQPLGQLAGRGRLTNKNKGGYIKVKSVSEPTILLGIFSITPRVDYSQGIDWKNNLSSLGELHAPNLDGIGYEDLLTEQFAWWNNDWIGATSRTTYSAGKVPAWSNYMTNVNKCYGNFAVEDEQMWMTFNRRYEQEDQNIGDLSTYIDPQKFNHIFADVRLDAMNYWVQISNRFITRRKMSAKQIPNL